MDLHQITVVEHFEKMLINYLIQVYWRRSHSLEVSKSK